MSLAFARAFLLCLSALPAAGCLSQHAYLDNKLPRVELAEIQPGAAPVPVRLVFEFQLNGAADAGVSKHLRGKVVTAMAETGLFKTIQDADSKDVARLEIVMNDTGDVAGAQMQGALSGLTLGLAGSLVTDHYIWDATWTAPGREPVKKRFEHELHTTVGNHDGPEGLEPIPMDQAVDLLIQQLVRITLRDLQNEAKVSG